MRIDVNLLVEDQLLECGDLRLDVAAYQAIVVILTEHSIGYRLVAPGG